MLNKNYFDKCGMRDNCQHIGPPLWLWIVWMMFMAASVDAFVVLNLVWSLKE